MALDFQGTLTVWTAFTDSTIANGCMQLMPGTHKVMHYDESKVMEYNDDTKINQTEKNGIRRGFFGYDYRQLQKDPNWSPDESKAESMEMKAGTIYYILVNTATRISSSFRQHR